VSGPDFPRRPRYSNSLKSLRRLIGGASTAHEKSRKERLFEHAAILADTEAGAYTCFINIQMANLFLEEFGVRLIANDRAVHVYEEWPGMDRRRISGSVLNCAVGFDISSREPVQWERTRLFFQGGGMGAAWEDDGPAGAVLRHLKAQALDHGAPAPFYRQRFTDAGYRKDQFRKLRPVDCPRQYGLLGGATADELKLATLSREKVNEAIMALREADPEFLKRCEEAERAAERLRLQFEIGEEEPVWGRYIRWAVDNRSGEFAWLRKQREAYNEAYEALARESGVETRKAKLKRINEEHRAWLAVVAPYTVRLPAIHECRQLDRSTPLLPIAWCKGFKSPGYRILDPERAGFAKVAGKREKKPRPRAPSFKPDHGEKPITMLWRDLLAEGKLNVRVYDCGGGSGFCGSKTPLNSKFRHKDFIGPVWPRPRDLIGPVKHWGNKPFDLPKWQARRGTRPPMPYGDPWSAPDWRPPEPLRPVRYRDVWPTALVNCVQIVT
jgi:hypothetical protein